MSATVLELLEQFPTEKVATRLPSPAIYEFVNGKYENPIDLWVGEDADIYGVLVGYGLMGERPDLDGFAVVTTGWAAPIPAEGVEAMGRPSEHMERRRVCLLTVVGTEGIGSRIQFFGAEGERQESVDDLEGVATGALADALLQTGLMVLGDKFAEFVARRLVAELEAGNQ